MASKHQKKLQKEAENQSVLISDPTLTLAEYIEKYIRTVVFKPGNGTGPGAKKGYREKLQTMQKWAVSQRPIRMIATDHIQETFNELLTSKKEGGKGLKVSTVQKYYDHLNNVFGRAVAENVILNNPFTTGIGIDRPKGSSKPLKQGLDPEMLWKWLRKSNDLFSKRDQAINWICVLTGLRPSEIGGLNWGDIDWDTHKPTLYVRRRVVLGDESYTEQNKAMVLPGAKSDRGVRGHFIHPRLLDFLREWKKYQKEHALFEQTDDTPIVTECHKGGIYQYDEEGNPTPRAKLYIHENITTKIATQAVKAVAELMDEGDITPTQLRHIHAWNLEISGLSNAQVAQYMGHETYDTTQRFYLDRRTDTSEVDLLKFIGHMDTDNGKKNKSVPNSVPKTEKQVAS